jgi:RNA 3'-terminal phosphate cyclase
MNAFATLLPGATSPLRLRNTDLQESTQQETRSLESFLATVERKAFRIAQIALRHEDDALDAVQDAMLRLVTQLCAPAERGVAATFLPHPRELRARCAAAAHGACAGHVLAALGFCR